ncbi:MAG: nucleotidyltransferase domain-containing protein, partial [Acidimicrobiia bacterium]
GRLLWMTSDGVPYGAPEVQLLYKSSEGRQKDDADLARTLHLLAREQKEWLLAAVGRRDATHPWISVLQNSIEGHRE